MHGKIRDNKHSCFPLYSCEKRNLTFCRSCFHFAEGEGYARWAKTFNLKQMAEAVCFIKKHDIATYKELSAKADAAVARFDALSDSIKSAEKRLTEIAALKKHIFNYSRTRDTFAAYKKSG